MSTSKFAIFFVWVCSFTASHSQTWELVEREISLSGELRVVNEGLSHDDTHWYLSNQHVLYKSLAGNDPLLIELQNPKAIPFELKEKRYDHIGDITVGGGVLFGGLESSTVSTGILAAWDTETLDLIRYKETSQKGMPWVALSSVENVLYSAEWNNCCEFRRYNASTFEELDPLQVTGTLLPPEIQVQKIAPFISFFSPKISCSYCFQLL